MTVYFFLGGGETIFKTFNVRWTETIGNTTVTKRENEEIKVFFSKKRWPFYCSSDFLFFICPLTWRCLWPSRSVGGFCGQSPSARDTCVSVSRCWSAVGLPDSSGWPLLSRAAGACRRQTWRVSFPTGPDEKPFQHCLLGIMAVAVDWRYSR